MRLYIRLIILSVITLYNLIFFTFMFNRITTLLKIPCMIWKMQNCFNFHTSCFNQLKKIALVNLRPSNKNGGKKPHVRYNFHVLIINHSDSKSLCRNSNETAGITPVSEIKLNRFQRMIMSRFDMLSPFIPNLRNFQSMSACATFSTDGQMAAVQTSSSAWVACLGGLFKWTSTSHWARSDNCVTSPASEHCHYWSLQKNDYTLWELERERVSEWLMLIRH